MEKDIEVSENGILRLNHKLPNGVYILRLKGGKGLYTTKFAVIR